MRAFGLIIGILQYAGLYVQLNAGLRDENVKVDNHISGNDYFQSPVLPPHWSSSTSPVVSPRHHPSLFTEVPRDIITQIGEDVEMACSFHGAGSPSFSLEIQWWYIKNHKDSKRSASQITNMVRTPEEMPEVGNKISVVKVAGSNISHKLRLLNVKPADEGMYECHVIDHSGPTEQRYRVQAYLQVEPKRLKESAQLQELEQHSRRSHLQQNDDRELRKRSVHSTNDCGRHCVV